MNNQELNEQYPNLHFREEKSGCQDVTVARWDNPNGGKWAGAETGYHFYLPLTTEIQIQLAVLHYEATCAQPLDWFFCTHCKRAKPRSKYAGYIFTDIRCIECASPEWIRTANNMDYR